MIYETVLKQALQGDEVKTYEVEVDGYNAIAKCGDEEPVHIKLPVFSEETPLEHYTITTEPREGLNIISTYIDGEYIPTYYNGSTEITREEYLTLREQQSNTK
ncbi:hypothetical protein [Enterobacter kobei]|uniref:hypothetical protein n=1 Tax=Enterobacter kobei TaxID=208224 RepID=UPI00244773F7|nr:hypothetical protein [Enterobacter kobei]MDH1372016.1 hypothetical protein [Enterobacter kobei]MDH1990416.1 hypothetical protein [Enterobacter kobei]MDH2008288.1 hypothetical protein [Enterobacter kobei]